jgi:TonB-linked SusC/RagA family outer membrane protein
MLCFAAFAQDKTVTGKVISGDDNSPLPGVAVVVKGTTAGGVTDIDGKFKIIVPQGGTHLIFSFVGYQNQEVEIGTQTTVDVIMKADVKQLEEVVVTALGLEQSRDKIGTASSQVNGASISKSGEATLINGIAGKASGVNIVRSSGDPGAGSYIQIRGQSTITGNLQPLVVVDGVPMYNSTLGNNTGNDGGVIQQSRLNDLNPNDIESMEILKGAAAAALWGTRAANGVIVITTKKGSSSKGKINVSYKATYSMDKLYLTHDLQDKFGQGANGRYQFAPSGGRSWGDKIAERAGGVDAFITEGQAGYQGYFEAADGTKFYAIANGSATNVHGGKNSRDTYDYRDQLFKTGNYLENAISVSGGDKDGNFFLSFSDMDQDGIIKENSTYRRTTARINAEKRVADKVKLGGNFTYAKTRSNRVQMGSNLSGLYLGGLRTPADFNSEYYVGTYVNPAGLKFLNRQRAYRNALGASTGSIYDNPLWMMKNVLDYSEVDRFIGSMEATVDVTNWLSITGRSGVDTYADRREEFFPSLSAGTNAGGRFTARTLKETQTNADLFARGTFKLNDDFNIVGMLGMNFNNRKYDEVVGQIRNFIIKDNPPHDLTNSTPENRSIDNDFEQIRTAALYGTVDLSYKDQLFVNLTGRSETASTFGRSAENTFFYPSASVAWQFTSAIPSLSNSNILSFGKLRASYGTVGVQPGAYQTATYFDPNDFAETWGPGLATGGYGGGYGQSTRLGNSDLKPERKSEIEFGADLRFFKDRVTLSATYYTNKTKDALLPVAVAPSTGFADKIGNVAEIENKGTEIDLGAKFLQLGDFSWNANVNWSMYRNKVVDLQGTQSLFLAGFTGTSSRAVEGEPLGVLWGVDFAKDDQGKMILDSRGFPTQATSESVIGNPNPDWKMGIGNTFKFKGVSLYVLIDRQQGGDVWAGTYGALTTFGRTQVTANESVAPAGGITAYNGAVIAEGTTFRGNIQDFGAGPVALTEAWYTGLGGGFGAVSSQFIQDASNTRIREISLGYTLSSEAFRNATKLSSIEFSVSGRNLMIWTKEFEGNDPETNLTGTTNGRGLEYFNNPATRSYLFSVKINY